MGVPKMCPKLTGFVSTGPDKGRYQLLAVQPANPLLTQEFSAGLLSSIIDEQRGVAQLGSAGALGALGRRFESCRPD